jgi:REP element-mobilizing transposase RayT
VPQSLSQLYIHIVFSTKSRRPFLQDPDLRSRTHAYLLGICKRQDCPSVATGGAVDHVHILCRLSKSVAVADLIRELKRSSSVWAKDEDPPLAEFHWQSGYGAFSVSPSHVEVLSRYIADQEEHHREESFQDEFRRLCGKYGVVLDEKFAWD